MTELERAMEIAINIISENCEVPYRVLVNKLFSELNKEDLAEYYDIITKFMNSTRSHLRRSNNL